MNYQEVKKVVKQYGIDFFDEDDIEVGDIVVGRVMEISNKRWKIDINASSAAYLNLNAAYIAEQRKKNQED